MTSSSIMKWDELNLLREEAVKVFAENPKKPERKRFEDYMEVVLCLVYDYGWKDAETIVGIVPFKDGLDDKTVNLEIANMTFRDRVEEQFNNGSVEGLLRIIETEAHRDYNTGVQNAAEKSGVKGIRKRWKTMLDPKVRETHSYLEGMTVDLNDRFYTFDGDSALVPGGFTLPDNNVNCRCVIQLVK